MNSKITSFLDDICIHVDCKAVHKDIRDELIHHIDGLKDEYIEQGLNEKTALDMAIAAMGDCDEIGNRLNEQHKPKTEWSLIGLTAIIAVIGGIIMFSSSKFNSVQAVSFERYLIYAIIGICVMVGIYLFDYTKLKKLALPIYIIAFALLVFTLLAGNGMNGRKILIIHSVSISSEYATLLFLIAFTGFMEKCRDKGGLAIVSLIALAFVSIIPITMLPSLSQTVILLVGYTVLVLSAVMKNHFGGNRKLQLISLGGIGAVSISVVMFIILSAPYRFESVMYFVSRGKSNPAGGGWQQMMADNWLAVSNLFGKTNETVSGYGIDMGMPSVTTDYVLVNIIATLGWAVGIALILIIALFIFRMFITTKKIKNDYGFYLSLAACTVLSLQFTVSLLMNFNLFPLMGVSLPFVSYGGTGYIVSMTLVGIILSVWRRNNLVGLSPKNVVTSKGRFIEFEDGKLIISFK